MVWSLHFKPRVDSNISSLNPSPQSLVFSSHRNSSPTPTTLNIDDLQFFDLFLIVVKCSSNHLKCHCHCSCTHLALTFFLPCLGSGTLHQVPAVPLHMSGSGHLTYALNSRSLSLPPYKWIPPCPAWTLALHPVIPPGGLPSFPFSTLGCTHVQPFLLGSSSLCQAAVTSLITLGSLPWFYQMTFGLN